MQEIEMFVMVDENGNFVVHADASELADLYANEVGENIGETATRIIRVALKVPTPKFVTVEATVPDQANEAAVVII